MTWNTSDKIILCALAFSIGFAQGWIPHTLRYVRDLALAPERASPGPDKRLQKDAEDSIKIDTLQVLADGYSYDLRASAVKIVANRAVKPKVKSRLLRHLRSKDEARRYDAINALWLLLFSQNLSEKDLRSQFLDYQSFYAVISALVDVLKEHPRNLMDDSAPIPPAKTLPPSPVRPEHRPSHETSLIWILRELLNGPRSIEQEREYPDNVTAALDAGLVTRWLKYYPFPCALRENSRFNFKRHDVCRLFSSKAWTMDDPLMGQIIHHILSKEQGTRQLRDVGLSVAEDASQSPTGGLASMIHLDTDIPMVNGESTAGIILQTTDGEWTAPETWAARYNEESDQQQQQQDQQRPSQPPSHRPVPRSRELSQEEQALRRRRREAVLVADAGAPLRRENIIQRQDSGTLTRSTSNLTSSNNQHHHHHQQTIESSNQDSVMGQDNMLNMIHDSLERHRESLLREFAAAAAAGGSDDSSAGGGGAGGIDDSRLRQAGRNSDVSGWRGNPMTFNSRAAGGGGVGAGGGPGVNRRAQPEETLRSLSEELNIIQNDLTTLMREFDESPPRSDTG